MRSNSGSGKSNNNLRDPTMKEHETSKARLRHRPAHGRAERAADAEPDQPQRAEAGPVD
jgi:hypothetical protein